MRNVALHRKPDHMPVRDDANEALDLALPGDLPNPYRPSWLDDTNANNTAYHLAARAVTDFDGLVADMQTAFASATAESNAQDSAFMRGMTNPGWKIAANVATLPLAGTKIAVASRVAKATEAARAARVGAADAKWLGELAAVETVAPRVGSYSDLVGELKGTGIQANHLRLFGECE